MGHGCLRAPSSASTAAGPERNLSPVEFQEIAAGNPGFEKLRDENRNQRDSDEEASVKARIARQTGARASCGIELHAETTIEHSGGKGWPFSDIYSVALPEV